MPECGPNFTVAYISCATVVGKGHKLDEIGRPLLPLESDADCIGLPVVISEKIAEARHTKQHGDDELLPIFISNIDEQDTHFVWQSFIYKPLYSQLKTAPSIKRYVPR